MKLLILVHVLSAILGVGPTFFGHVLLRRNQTLDELRHATTLNRRLEYFPKIGGSIAVLSGLALFFLGEYGSFTKLWLLGSLVLYILIQVVVIALISPSGKKLAALIFDPAASSADAVSEDVRALQLRTSRMYYLASAMGLLLFIFMIVKPGD